MMRRLHAPGAVPAPAGLRRLAAAGAAQAPGRMCRLRAPGAAPAPAGPRRLAVAGAAQASGRMRRLRTPSAVPALAAVLMLAVLPATGADPWDGSLNGLVDTRARARQDNATKLVPAPDRIGLDTRVFSITTVAGLEAWKGPVAVAGQLRARNAPGEEGRTARFHVDELYAEYALTPEHYLYAGRRHIVHGRSLGVNPLDVAVDPRDLDRSKDTNRRRNEIEGQDMLGFESLLGERFTLAGYRTPGERTLLAGVLTLPEWKSDLTVLAFDDERPGAGLSFSRTLGEAVLLYGDAVARRGRDRPAIRADRASGADPGAFLVEAGGRSRLFPRTSLGASFTLESGASFNLEHYFDANGYSSGEWEEITGLIAGNDANRRAGRFGGLPTGNLLRLGGQLDPFTLRRHYGLLRAHHPRLFGRDLAAEATVFHNLTDHSGSAGLRLEHGMGPNLVLGVEGRWLYGKDLDEFGLRTARLAGSVHVTVHF